MSRVGSLTRNSSGLCACGRPRAKNGHGWNGKQQWLKTCGRCLYRSRIPQFREYYRTKGHVVQARWYRNNRDHKQRNARDYYHANYSQIRFRQNQYKNHRRSQL